jgi:hypothetical protein
MLISFSWIFGRGQSDSFEKESTGKRMLAQTVDDQGGQSGGQSSNS